MSAPAVSDDQFAGRSDYTLLDHRRAFLRCLSVTSLEQPAVENNVVVVIHYLQAPIEN